MKVTDYWLLYEAGKTYNTKINLYHDVNRNTEFYIGNQWVGVKSNGLDKPVFNIIKRVINYFRAVIMPQDIKVNLVPELLNELSPTEKEVEIKELSDLASAHIEDIWEKNKIEAMIREVLLDCANSGDGCVYTTWNPDIDLGLPKMEGVPYEDNIKGDIENQILDNVNVFFGNPNDHKVNHRGRPTQPYILIAFRQLVSELKEEAKKYGQNPKNISPDEDYQEQIGQYGKTELENTDVTGKATVLLKMYPKDGKIHCVKAGKFGIIRPEWNTKLTLYPIAWMNWDIRKNCYHGQALATEMIPNQVFINKSFAMLMLWLKQMSIPKIFYDNSLIQHWSNVIGQAIGVEGNPTQAAYSMNPSQLSNQVFTLIDKAIQYTKEFLGVSDVGLGQISDPDNAAAIGTAIEQVETPLTNYRNALYQFVEDWMLIWIDYMANYYGKRYVTAKDEEGKSFVKEVDFNLLKKHKFRIKIDVGSTSKWSEIASMKTLDNLLQLEKISFLQYLKSYPEGKIPRQTELIKEIEEHQKQDQQLMNLNEYVQSLPEKEQERLAQLPDEQFQIEVKKLMAQQGL